MRNAISKFADAACLVSAAAMVVLVGSKGLGAAYPEAVQFWTLQAMHLFFLASFGFGLVSAVRARDRARTVVYALPLVGVAASIAGAIAGTGFPAPLLIVFDLYLIVVCALSLAAPPVLRLPRAADLRPVPQEKAYELLNTGGLVVVCTKGSDGRYDLAPIAWSCPLDYEPSSRVMIVLDPGHLTSENIAAAKEFALALPSFGQRALVEKTGSASGREADKYERFGIASFAAEGADALVPEGSAGYLSCRLIDERRIGSVVVFSAEVVRAAAVKDAWRYRLHYAGGKAYYRPGTAVGVREAADAD